MATSDRPSTQPQAKVYAIGTGWINGLLGGREIEKRVDQNFPSWQDYSSKKPPDAQSSQAEQDKIDIPTHRLTISSPLQGNFLYLILVTLTLMLGIYSPNLGPVLVYGAIGLVLMTSLFMVFRDAMFLHIEGQRLEADAEMINKHAKGPKTEQERESLGFMQSGGKRKKSNLFRSRLLQIHYQNILRTFEQGNRRTWVDQDASIAELHTLLTQRGMKMVWTMIEVLPQLGLLGTLIGLMKMFMAFRAETASPEVAILAGFGTALGTTVVANVLVLVLRPLYMRNERSMNEVLSTIQTLMATFILPTQQTVLERTVAAGFGRADLIHPPAHLTPAPAPGINEARLFKSLDDLSHTLGKFADVQQQVDSGAMAEQTAEIAEDVRATLKAFADSVDRDQVIAQRNAFEQLTLAIQGLERNLNRIPSGHVRETKTTSERIENDLTQLRVLTHDTLLLLEHIAGQLGPSVSRGGRMLSTDRKLRSQIFAPSETPGTKADKTASVEEEVSEETTGPVRLFKGPA